MSGVLNCLPELRHPHPRVRVAAESVVSRLGLSGASLLYRWKANLTSESGPAATALESRVQELEKELRRVEQERDILKKALAIFSQKT